MLDSDGGLQRSSSLQHLCEQVTGFVIQKDVRVQLLLWLLTKRESS